ncbi:MAG: cation transporter [Paludibacteraceae bacterium]|nr:cation transporter [Paludibacteraceae bacterium]MBN2788300.1 cation transporter [Paludibacteraceae bacterium]
MVHKHNQEYKNGKNIKIAFFLNFFFSIIEFIGGYFTNSVAILSDALHDLGDSFSLLLAWYFQKVSGKTRDKKYSYGYKRFSLLGALINSVILLVGSGFILHESILRFSHPQQPFAEGMILLAVLGIFINGLAVFRLKQGDSINEKVVSLHLLEDVLGWVAVLLVSVIMLFVNAPFLDPLLSIGIACFILYNVYKNLRSTFKVILQGIPENIDEEEIKKTIQNTEGVMSIHDLHIWSMDGEYIILTAHIVANSSIQTRQQTDNLKALVKEKLISQGIHHPTIEIEYENSTCIGGCC